MIIYETILPATGNLDEIFDFIKKSDVHFIPPLSDRVDLLDHTKKLLNNATLFVARDEGRIIGLHATYFNAKPEMSFATYVYVEEEYQGEQLVGVDLIMNSYNYCKAGNSAGYWGTFRKSNKAIFKFYTRLGFKTEEDGVYPHSNELRLRCIKYF